MTDSAMQKHLYDHKHELRDLEDRLSHIVVICLIFYLFTACTYFLHYFFTVLYNPATAAVPNKPFIPLSTIMSYHTFFYFRT